MRHLPILLNVISLCFGVACVAKLFAVYRADRSGTSLAKILFFLSYTYLLSAGFLFGYYMINVGSGYRAETILAGLIFTGMAAVELTFPGIASPARSEGESRRRRPILMVAALLTALQAPLIVALKPSLAFLPLALAFAAFAAVIAWSLAAASPRSAPGARAAAFFPYLPVLAIAAAEFAYLAMAGSEGPYALVSLPLAYALTSIQFMRAAAGTARNASPPPGSSVPTRLPPGLVRRASLSPREEETAALILQGKDNKEIAAALGLSGNTVRNHVYGLFKKLGIQRRMDLLRLIRDFKPD